MNRVTVEIEAAPEVITSMVQTALTQGHTARIIVLSRSSASPKSYAPGGIVGERSR